MQLQIQLKLTEYNPLTGELRSRRTGKPMYIDDLGYVVLYDSNTKAKLKIKADKLAWQVGNAKLLRKDNRILHRNLEPSDIRLQNLMAVPRSIFNQISEAHRNLTGALRLAPHKLDQYSYMLSYKDKGVDYHTVIQDIVVARQRYMKLQLKYAKILSKYCIFD